MCECSKKSCSCKKKPHKHAEVIKAWADGAKIQALTGQSPDYGVYWVDVANPTWFESIEYRIKSDVVKVKYRRYLMFHVSSDFSTDYHVAIFPYQREWRSIENMYGFLRWIDNDWIEEEVSV